ncbi:MAG: hypothetical protein Q8O74_02970 [bacterium]|nr:hypothetical protein [bacterium]
MEQKTIQEAIQIFCPICSKGILVRNESMYKCKKCGKEVCQICFDRQVRLCVECASEAKKENTYLEQRPGPREPSGKTGRQSRKVGLFLLIAGLVVIPAAFLVGVIVNLPHMPIVVGVLELAGFGMFIKGFMMLRD